jgi:DNA-binding HxlR family transcriptional regulator
MNLLGDVVRANTWAMKSYNQYCPIARTSELFAERWTPIIVRNLLAGCRTFTEIKTGAPGIPKALLTQRLGLLERHGVLVRTSNAAGRGPVYELTDKGLELQTVCDAMGNWGARWLEIEPNHLDPAYVLWATCRLVDLDRVPGDGVVVRVDVTRSKKQPYWMVLLQPRAEICTASMGRQEDLVLTTDMETLSKYNLRQITFQEAIRTGHAQIDGPRDLALAFPTWIRPSPFADVPSTPA